MAGSSASSKDSSRRRGKNVRRSNGSKRTALLRTVKRQEEEQGCHLCGQWVDIKLGPGLDASPEVDELVPVTYGGSPYDRANCRLAHRYCNRFRWHGPVLPAQQALRANPPTFGADGMRVSVPLAPVVSRVW